MFTAKRQIRMTKSSDPCEMTVYQHEAWQDFISKYYARASSENGRFLRIDENVFYYTNVRGVEVRYERIRDDSWR